MNRRNHPVEIDHIDPRWKEGRDYQLVCGLDCPANFREEDWKRNSSKSNRFLPWRWSREEIGVVPTYPGDLAYFLVGADIKNDIPGEWLLLEFLSEDWFEASKGTLGSVALRHLRDNSAVVRKQWETFRQNPELLEKRNKSVSEGLKRWRIENPEKAEELQSKLIEANLESRERDKEKWAKVAEINSELSKQMWEENPQERKESIAKGVQKWKEENPGEYLKNLEKLNEGKRKWIAENPGGCQENLEKAREALQVWREENPEQVDKIVEKLQGGYRKWKQSEDYQRYSTERSVRLREMAKQKWKCVISGRVSTAAGLSHIQKSLGIDHKDPNNRIRIN